MGHSRGTLLLVGLVVGAVGAFLLLDVLGMFPGSAARLAAPRWVAFMTAFLFFAAGMYVLLMAIVGERGARAFGTVLGLAMFLGLAVFGRFPE